MRSVILKNIKSSMDHQKSMEKQRAPRNRTLTISSKERELYINKILYPTQKIEIEDLMNKTICADLFKIIDQLPISCVATQSILLSTLVALLPQGYSLGILSNPIFYSLSSY